jgi:hypothetical protein
MAIQSRKTRWGSHAPRTTASAWMTGMDVYAPPNERLPATSPRAKRCGESGMGQIPSAKETGEGNPRYTTYRAKPMYCRRKSKAARIYHLRE